MSNGTDSPSRCIEAIANGFFEIALHPDLIVPRYDHTDAFVATELLADISFHLTLGKAAVRTTRIGQIAAQVCALYETYWEDEKFCSQDGFRSHQAWNEIRNMVRGYLTEVTGYSDWENRGK